MNNNNPSISLEDVDQNKSEMNFSDKELKKLYRRFKKLDSDGSGSISVEEFLTIPELAVNPLLERIISIFDTNHNGEIEFSEFISGLSTFTQKDKKEAKLRFVFQIYDVDCDGYISNGELFQVLKIMVGNNLNDIQLQQIVDKTILEADKDKDGRVSFDEFVGLIGNTDDIETKLTVNFD